MAGGYNFDEEVAVRAMRHQIDLKEAIQKFADVGVTRIKECGITGGTQAAKLNSLVESIEDKIKEALEYNDSSIEAISNIIENIGNFDAQTIMDKARQSAEDIQKADKVVAKKVDFA